MVPKVTSKAFLHTLHALLRGLNHLTSPPVERVVDQSTKLEFQKRLKSALNFKATFTAFFSWKLSFYDILGQTLRQITYKYDRIIIRGRCRFSLQELKKEGYWVA